MHRGGYSGTLRDMRDVPDVPHTPPVLVIFWGMRRGGARRVGVCLHM